EGHAGRGGEVFLPGCHLVERQAGGAEARRSGKAAQLLEHPRRRAGPQPELVRGRLHRLGRADDRARAGRPGRLRDEAAGDVDDLAAGGDVDDEVGVGDRQAVDRLLEGQVRGAGEIAGVVAGDEHAVEVGGGHAEVGAVGEQVAAGDVEGGSGRRGGEEGRAGGEVAVRWRGGGRARRGP